MTVSSKIEVPIKVNQIPISELSENNWYKFAIDFNGKQVAVSNQPKGFWNKFKAQAEQRPE